MPFSSRALPGCSKQEVTPPQGGHEEKGRSTEQVSGVEHVWGEERGCRLTFPAPNSPPCPPLAHGFPPALPSSRNSSTEEAEPEAVLSRICSDSPHPSL